MNVCGMGPVLSDYMMDFIIVVCYAMYAAESSAGRGITMKESMRC